ncbi:elongation factor P--(R)-beta-lysine ligase [Candidatus Legionella polyplacis]|uniref:Elongation factor P--(R)-beta-lysine ligase n=1 Tax=Candidatus Legionella polyplacis TaxID=2005262 RepID=A0ABZ2H0U6_9GAMM
MKDIDWQPSSSMEVLRVRAKFLMKIRKFFYEKGYLEVETPILSHFGVTDVYIENIRARSCSKFVFLQSSPEYHMKRLLAFGSGSIFQIARVFRDNEIGNWHNPEFTLLEWYSLNINHYQLLDEVEFFLKVFLSCNRLVKKSYKQIFIDYCNIDPISSSIDDLKWILQKNNLESVFYGKDIIDRDQCLYLLMTHVVVPNFTKEIDEPVAIYDFPLSQALLAQVDKEGFAKRFEIYFKGVELANGFNELIDLNAHIHRFNMNLINRKKMGLDLLEVDYRFLKALEFGLPVCSGVAIGIDRLLALKLGYSKISDVMSFDFNRC